MNLDIIGTMCIPPNDDNTERYFSEMNKINQELNLKANPPVSPQITWEQLKTMQHTSE